MFFLSLFRRKNSKWHEVRWRSGPRDIYLALQFAAEGANGSPRVEVIPSRPISDHSAAEHTRIVAEVQAAIEEYNRLNLCELRVGVIRYRANAAVEATDHGKAARKLLNLL